MQDPESLATVAVTVFQMGKLKPSEMKERVPGHSMNAEARISAWTPAPCHMFLDL